MARIFIDSLRKVTNTILMDRGGLRVQNDYGLDRARRHHLAYRGIYDVQTRTKSKRRI